MCIGSDLGDRGWTMTVFVAIGASGPPRSRWCWRNKANGWCPASATSADLRLARFFHKDDPGYRVRDQVRELVIFAAHNVLSDPPFSRVDLAFCRNLLIYLERSAQRQVVQALHYALRPGGFIVLGSSETIEESDLFSSYDKKHAVELRSTLDTLRQKGRPVVSRPVRFKPRGESPRAVVLNVRPAMEPQLSGFALLIFDERDLPQIGDSNAMRMGKWHPPMCACAIWGPSSCLRASGSRRSSKNQPRARSCCARRRFRSQRSIQSAIEAGARGHRRAAAVWWKLLCPRSRCTSTGTRFVWLK